MKKRIFVALLAIMMLSSTCFIGVANAVEDVSANQTEYSEDELTPRADVIVTKFRMHNGQLQYRRWNETQGYWVDPAWINLD